ncbi:hypothetical protein C8R46DRAFT_1188712 [Mycena filopes]|nr:hypothetical protein C8R46DRAFT_1188712 [Mycena filopes]
MEKDDVLAQGSPDPSEEAAGSQLWAVYVSEAEKYDRSLVESWKSDMEGMLIFAGLFSASLTAFIIESYKTLMPDSNDATLQMLTQISQQLAAAADGRAFQASPPPHFSPLATSLVCNSLWFISLGLSLTCALIATLLEQWARDFLHRADMRSAPVIRARIFSYLYYGLKRFHMHTVVDVIPLLLHTSLVFFFAGLVAFLWPINIAIAILAAALLAIVLSLYSFLTVLPLWWPDCPYRTPLSTATWRVSNIFMTFWRRHNLPQTTHPARTMVEEMSRQATTASPGRASRDYRALVWTIKSLADDGELEPFVEAIPDVLWGPLGRRHAYEENIQMLVRHPDLRLKSRIEDLLRSCDSGLLSPEASRRRQTTSYKALWAISSVQPLSDGRSLDFTRLIDYYETVFADSAVQHYAASAIALLDWSTYCSVKATLDPLFTHLGRCQLDVAAGRTADLQPIVSFLATRGPRLRFRIGDRLSQYMVDPTSECTPPSVLIADCQDALREFCTITPYEILFHYLSASARLDSAPYRWETTRELLHVDVSAPFGLFEPALMVALDIVGYRQGPLQSNSPGQDWNDTLMLTLLSFWKPNEPVPIPQTIIIYLNVKGESGRLKSLLFPGAVSESNTFGRRLWTCFPATLEESPSPGLMTALWHVAFTTQSFYPAGTYEPVLDALKDLPHFPDIKSSIVSVLKTKVMYQLLSHGIHPLRHPLLPTVTALSIPDELPNNDEPSSEIMAARLPALDGFSQLVRCRITEARIGIIAEFLDNFHSDFTPYNPIRTLKYICWDIAPRGEVHAEHQIRLADGMNRILKLGMEHPHATELLDTLIGSKLFEPYIDAAVGQSARNLQPTVATGFAWLQDPTARNKIKDTLADYAEKLASSGRESARVSGILTGLDSPALHPSSFGPPGLVV